jgi:heat shock protein HtpX
MANLYSQADSNIRKTWLLIVFFLIFVIGLGWGFSYLLGDISFLIVASLLALLQVVTGWFYSDRIILKMSGAQKIEKKDHPELYRIVENLSITAGLPLPEIYISKERQPNAFTTGRKKEEAKVVVTQGLLDKLNRRELEGVIAHELAHVGNRDVFLASLVVVLVSVVAILSRLFLRFSYLRGRGRDRKRSSGLLSLLGLVGALLAPFVASLIRLSISRKREFLADADGALLTRDPQGLADALKKISSDNNRMKVNSSTAHLYFSNPLKEKDFLAKLFMAHPPVEERIKALKLM